MDVQTIRRLLGHTDIKTTMIYLQTVPTLTLKQAKSPLDCMITSPSAPNSGRTGGPAIAHLRKIPIGTP